MLRHQTCLAWLEVLGKLYYNDIPMEIGEFSYFNGIPYHYIVHFMHLASYKYSNVDTNVDFPRQEYSSMKISFITLSIVQLLSN